MDQQVGEWGDPILVNGLEGREPIKKLAECPWATHYRLLRKTLSTQAEQHISRNRRRTSPLEFTTNV